MLKLMLRQGKVRIQMDKPEWLRGNAAAMRVTTDLLGKAYHANMGFEEPDGAAYQLDSDFLGSEESRWGCDTGAV